MSINTNSNRHLVSMIQDICQQYNIECHSYSHQWILQLRHHDKVMYVFGYKFPVNNSCAEHLANDKSATSDILRAHGVPCVQHVMKLPPSSRHCIEDDGVDMERYLAQHQVCVVKPNDYTGGDYVYRVHTIAQLHESVDNIFGMSRSVCLCPYEDIEHEYRVVMHHGIAKLVYEKIRPYVVGDGLHTVLELSHAKYGSEVMMDMCADTVLPRAQQQIVSWRHNLGKGATPMLVEDIAIIDRLVDMAQRSTIALQLEFASVDIITAGNTYKVLEVNSGVMMEAFASTNQQYYTQAYDIYRDVVLEYFALTR